MISAILSRLVILLFGTLYPAYASYKAVKTKNVKEYVKWMMYWIVFALFTCAETFTDVFLSWFPFYYEIKIILVIWLLSPATKGSSILYRKFVHPMLSSREQEIDEYISKAKEQSYKQVLDLGSKGVSVLMQTAIKSGGGLVNQLKKSYSLSDLSEEHEGQDEVDVTFREASLARRRTTARSATTSAVYFSEIDLRSGGEGATLVHSLEDISSGYSSGECLYPGQPPKLQPREGISRTGSLTRSRSTRSTKSGAVSKRSLACDESDDNEVFDTIFLNDKKQEISKLPRQQSDSSSEGEFVDSLDHLHGKKTDNSKEYDKTLLTACQDNRPNPVKAGSANKISTEATKPARGGKYHKKAAPKPPPTTAPNEDAAIKATLVLTPGVVKPLGVDSTAKEVFIHSPKMKRKSSKLGSLSKLMKLPKKVDFWNRDKSQNLAVPGISKRSSWHDFFHNVENRDLADTKPLSKSDCDVTINKQYLVPLQKSNSKSSCRLSGSKTESPFTKRRLKIVRMYIDEDID